MAAPRIAVLTTTIPGREQMLAECRASVAAQTLPADEHRVILDENLSEKPGLLLNEMAVATRCDWLVPLADDDLLDPSYLERCAEFFDGYDVVYAWCRVEGRQWNPNQKFDPKGLRSANYIPATACVRRGMWEKTGGWGDQTRMEDWHFWLKVLERGGRFYCIEEELWTYRFGPWGNKSLKGKRR